MWLFYNLANVVILKTPLAQMEQLLDPPVYARPQTNKINCKQSVFVSYFPQGIINIALVITLICCCE